MARARGAVGASAATSGAVVCDVAADPPKRLKKPPELIGLSAVDDGAGAGAASSATAATSGNSGNSAESPKKRPCMRLWYQKMTTPARPRMAVAAIES